MMLDSLKGEALSDALGTMIEPIMNIAEDKEASTLFQALFSPQKPPDGCTRKEFIHQQIRKSLPVLLKKHKKDVVAVLAGFNGMEPEEYAEQMTLGRLVTDLHSLINAKEKIEVFLSSQTLGKEG